VVTQAMPNGFAGAAEQVGAAVRSHGVYLVIGDEYTPSAERDRGVHERLRTRARCVERWVCCQDSVATSAPALSLSALASMCRCASGSS
jgi:hypothetical protein